ncbi:MAG: DUF3006 domain-containing protein [Armatimonadota bacterium]
MRAFVDSIHDGIATLLLGDDESVTVRVPVSWLPAGVTEGMALRFDVSIDETEKQAGKTHVQSLLDELGNNP